MGLEKEDGNRREEEIWVERGKKTEQEEDNNFKPAFSRRFQTGAVANTVRQRLARVLRVHADGRNQCHG
jgi:hypothetical protein